MEQTDYQYNQALRLADNPKMMERDKNVHTEIQTKIPEGDRSV